MGLSVIKKWMMITKDIYSPTIRTRFHSIQVPLLHVNCTTTPFQMEHLLHTTYFCTWFTWDIIASIKFCTRILFFLVQYIKHQFLFLCLSQSPSIDLNSANKKYNRSIVHTLLLGHTINAKDPLYIGIDFHFTRFHQRTLRVQEFIKGLTGKLNDFHPPSTTVINSHKVL